MPKAESILAAEVFPVGSDQLLAYERSELWRDRLAVGREGLHGAPVKALALDRAALEHVSLRGLQLVEPGGEQRAESGRDDDVALFLAGKRKHLGHEERVPASRSCDLTAQIGVDPVADELGDGVVLQRPEPESDGPDRPVLRELWAGQAEKQD